MGQSNSMSAPDLLRLDAADLNLRIQEKHRTCYGITRYMSGLCRGSMRINISIVVIEKQPGLMALVIIEKVESRQWTWGKQLSGAEAAVRKRHIEDQISRWLKRSRH